MPLPMVHLSVAVALSEREHRFPSGEFLLGNLAPDAIHMRPNTVKLDKERVHMLDSGCSAADLVNSFQARYIRKDSPSMGFHLGYLTHLLTDRIWRERIIDPFRLSLVPTFPDQEIRSRYYHDTDRIDFDLYRRMAWQPQAWSSLETAPAVDFPPFLTANEILHWRDRTLLWYRNPGHDPQADTVYIHLDRTLTFIAEAAVEIAGILAT